MKSKVLLALPALAACLSAQVLDPSWLLNPPPDSWPTFNGDYTGKRFSELRQLNQKTVHSLTPVWMHQIRNGEGPGTIVGGEATAEQSAQSGAADAGSNSDIKSQPLLLNGVLYFATTDNAWAVDARTGQQLWHYYWRTLGGIHIGNRGVGIYGNWLYFETPDNYLVSLDARTGKERWHKQIADVKQEYFSTPAPVIIGNHVMVGTGGDSLDVPGFLEARDPETGDVQWRWWTEPLKKGDPGSETWPDQYAMRHGGGMTWMPGTYDPGLHLYYIGTGNPNPVLAGQSRKGDDLWTCSIVALNVDTGKMAWWFQPSPHDTHDWDATQTPVLIDGTWQGKSRKMLAQASRNGFYFLLDRATGEHLATRPFIETLNWAKGVDQRGEPIPDPGKEASIDGVLVSPATGGATNWPAPSYDPQTKLFYVRSAQTFSEFYLTDTDPHPEGWGAAERNAGGFGNTLRALDYQTGKLVWRHDYPGFGYGGSGILTTAGDLLFTGDGSQHLIAFDPANGKIVWHAGLLGSVSNGPETYMLDGKQYILVGAGDTLYAFAPSD